MNMADGLVKRRASVVRSADLRTDFETIFEPTRQSPGEAKLLRLPQIPDQRGNLTFVEGNRHLPFDIARVYYLYDVPAGSARAGHAHVDLAQVVIAASGSFDVHIENAHERVTVSLNRSNVGLFISRLIWRDIDNFSSGSVCLVLASMPYSESDYIREYDQFRRMVSGGRN